MSDSSRLKVYCLAGLSGIFLWAGGLGEGVMWPILLFALVPMLTALQGAAKKRAVGCGLIVGLFHFVTLLYWVVIAVGRYGGFPWYLSCPTLLLLALYMSLFVIVFALSARFLINNASPLVTVWAVPCIWVGLDWIRSFLFSGFPWMDLGYALWKIPFLIQVADLVGHHGVTFLLVLINVLLALLLNGKLKNVSVLPIVLPVMILLACAGSYSAVRWHQTETEMEGARRARIGVVQGNIDQGRKWIPEEQKKTVMNYLGRTDFLSAASQLDLVVWPETALPFYPPNSPLMIPLRTFMQKSDFSLLTGSPWYEILDREKRDIRFSNRAFLLLPDGSYGDYYDKSHLVPYGEYVPVKKLFPFLAPLVEAVGDFTPGKVGEPLQYKGIKGGVLICFESIFPGIAREWVKNGANVLINLTNDAWYGKSSAPYQSFAMSIFRAVENRRSLIRSANTGISGFIDPLGRIMMSSQIFVPWAASVDIALMEEITFAVRYGYLFAPLCFLLGVGMCLGVLMRRRQEISGGS